MSELFDLYDEHGQKLGLVKERAAVHRDGDWHRSIHIWIVRPDGTLVFQKRSSRKDTMPSLLTASVSGHYAAGETLTQVLREAYEEVGIAVTAGNLLPVGFWRYEERRTLPTIIDREWQDIFFWPCSEPLSGFKPDPVEVEALVEFEADSLAALFNGSIQKISALYIEALERSPRQADFVLGDFVPTSGYHKRVIRAALAYASGRTLTLNAE